MKINTKELKEITKKIAVVLAADNKADYLNIKSSDNNDALYFSLTNTEFYVAFKLVLTTEDAFNVTVDTKAFVDMINSLASEEVELIADDNILKIVAGKSKYKLPMVISNGVPREPAIISTTNPTVDMVIPATILTSINDINSQEFARVPDAKIKNPANKLYHISDSGCFTAANSFGACLNSFKLDQPLDLLINRRIAKLFTLFTTDPEFTFELATTNGITQAIITLANADTRLGALTTADPKLRSVLISMVTKIRQLASSVYQNKLVINTNDLLSALNRLATAAKYTGNKSAATNEGSLVTFTATGNSLILSDDSENSEELTLAADSSILNTYEVTTIIPTLKSIVAMCSADTITIQANAHSPLMIEFGSVKYFITPIIR